MLCKLCGRVIKPFFESHDDPNNDKARAHVRRCMELDSAVIEMRGEGEEVRFDRPMVCAECIKRFLKFLREA